MCVPSSAFPDHRGDALRYKLPVVAALLFAGFSNTGAGQFMPVSHSGQPPASHAEQLHCPLSRPELQQLACGAAPVQEKVQAIRDRGAAVSAGEVLTVATIINSCGRGKQHEVVEAIEDTLRPACKPSPATTGAGHAPLITSFVASPSEVMNGGLALVLWQTTDAVRVTLDGQDVPASGERTLFGLRANTTETLAAYDTAGNKEQRVLAIVVKPQTAQTFSAADSMQSGSPGQTPAQWSIAGLTFGMSLDEAQRRLGGSFRSDLKLTAPDRKILVDTNGSTEAFVFNTLDNKLTYIQRWTFYPRSSKPDKLALASELEHQYGPPTSRSAPGDAILWLEWIADDENRLLSSVHSPLDKCGFHTGGWQFLPIYAQQAARENQNVPYLGGAALDFPITLYPKCTRSLYAEEIPDTANGAFVRALNLKMIDPQPLARYLQDALRKGH